MAWVQSLALPVHRRSGAWRWGRLPGGLSYPLGVAHLPYGGLALGAGGENAVLIAGEL